MRVIILREIFSRFGLSEVFVADNGPFINSEEFRKFSGSDEIHKINIPPYHPKSHGSA